MAKLDLRIKESGRDSIKIELGGKRRLLYLLIFILLTITVFLSLDPEVDFSSSRIGGTLFTFMLILLSLGVSITIHSFKIDKSSATIVKNIGLPAGIMNFYSREYKLGSNPRFITSYLGELHTEQSLKRTFDLEFKGSVKKGKIKFRLSIETEDHRILICESSYKGDIDTIALYLSQYLGIPLKNET